MTNVHSQARNPFGVIYDKVLDVERIRRTQRPIPKSTNHFLKNKDWDSSSELTFSVSLQFSGPDVADLSFCDLPGDSNVTPWGKQWYENLVTSYIKMPTCVILVVDCESMCSQNQPFSQPVYWTVPPADFENQGAYRLTRVHEPERKRTTIRQIHNYLSHLLLTVMLGFFLTKPDQIPTSDFTESYHDTSKESIFYYLACFLQAYRISQWDWFGRKVRFVRWFPGIYYIYTCDYCDRYFHHPSV